MWAHQVLSKNDHIPEEIYLEILGSRKPVVFVEGDRTSLDYLLYSVLFPEFSVNPIGGCEKVIDATKTFNSLNNFHHLNASGIVDLDRRTDADVSRLRDNRVSVLKLAEVENLFLIEPVVKLVAQHMHRNTDEIFQHVKSKVISVFAQDMELQLIEHTVYRMKKSISESTNGKATNWNDLETVLTGAFDMDTYKTMYNDLKNEFGDILSRNDYEGILKVANIKKLLERSDLAMHCGLQNNGDSIRNLIINILKSKDSVSSQISLAMREYVSIM